MTRELMWVEKYRPQKPAEVVGNEEAKSLFLRWLRTNRWRKKPALLYGPPGVGKSALVYAAAHEFKYRIIEMNASDTRTEKSITKIAGPATSFVALDTFTTETEGSLLFLDEVDGIFGREDRGGVSAILTIFGKKAGTKGKGKKKQPSEPQIPVVLAANDPDLQKLRPLKRLCTLIRFRKVRIPFIVMLLQRIALMEHVTVDIDTLTAIARSSEGDVRSAINDLQTLSEASGTLQIQDLTRLRLRNRNLDIYETLKELFSAKSPKDARNILNRATINYDELMLSIHDNLPYRYKDPVKLGLAYDYLSRADVFRGRIGFEHWRFLVHFFNFLAQTTTVPSQPFQPFEFIYPPMRISTLFWTKGKRTTLETICTKIGKKCHVSRRSAKRDFLPYVRMLLQQKQMTSLGTWLKLDDREIDYLLSLDQL